MSKRFSRLRGLFDDMVDLPDADREAAILASCAGDGSLEGELRALFADESRSPEDGPCSG